MADISWKIKLPASEAAKLNKELAKEIRAKIKSSWESISGEITEFAKEKFAEKIKEHPTFSSLRNGELKGELGLTNQLFNSFENEIDNVIQKNLRVRYVASATSPRMDLGGILVYFEEYVEYFLDTKSADYPSINRHNQSTQIFWLSWLLKESTKQLIFNWRYIEDDKAKGTRSGKGFMGKKEGSSYAIDEDFAGTRDNNFITQAAKKAEPEIAAFALNKLLEISK